jgi:hypothetical protein
MRQLLGAFMDNASQEGMIEPLRLTGNGIQNFFFTMAKQIDPPGRNGIQDSPALIIVDPAALGFVDPK